MRHQTQVKSLVIVLSVLCLITSLFTLHLQPALATSITADGVTCTLADAITAINTLTATGGCPAGNGINDTITMTADVTVSSTATNLPDLTRSMRINGNGHTITGFAANNKALINSSTANVVIAIDNLTITGNTNTVGNGGGIAVLNGSLDVNGSVVTNNSAPAGGSGGISATLNGRTINIRGSIINNNSSGGFGGGIGLARGTMTISGTDISGNTAAVGGGFVNDTGTVTVNVSTITNNTATATGGGIANNASLTINASLISGNTNTGATEGGGGIGSAQGSVTVNNSTITNNSSTSFNGGAFQTQSGAILTVNGSTVSNNTSGGSLGGGVVYLRSNSRATFTNSTFVGNVANGASIGGGAIFSDSTNAAAVTLVNSTFSGNSAPSGATVYMNGGGLTSTRSLLAQQVTATACTFVAGTQTFTDTQVDDTSCTGTATASVNTDLSTTLANNGGPTQTLALTTNAGHISSAACSVTIDQRGVPRPNLCDLGAFQTGGSIGTVTITVCTTTVNKPGGLTTATVSTSGVPAGGSGSLYLVVDKNGDTGANGIDYSLTAFPTTYTGNQSQTFNLTGLNSTGTQTVTIWLAGFSGPVNSSGASSFTITLTPGIANSCAVVATATNTATVTATSTNTPGATATSTATAPAIGTPGSNGTPQIAVADPAITKLGSLDFALPGEAVTFTLTVTNIGTLAATGVVVTDVVPSQFVVISASQQQGTNTITGNTVVFSVGTVSPGQVIILTVNTRVSASVQPPVTLVNTATLNADGGITRTSSATVRVGDSRLPNTGKPPETTTELPYSSLIILAVLAIMLAGTYISVQRRRLN